MDLSHACRSLPSKEEVKAEVDQAVESISAQLYEINHAVIFTATPLASCAKALTELSDLQQSRARVGRKQAVAGHGGRVVNYNAELDALPGIGNACGHNLIAIASLAGFWALQSILKQFGVQGTVQLLGTPAKSLGGGKINLMEAGAYKKSAVSLMGNHGSPEFTGAAGKGSIAHLGITCTFTGHNAHAGSQPWEGINALDALVSAYNNISMLRQQMRPEERVHGCVLEAPKVANIIPDRTRVYYSVRSPTKAGLRQLGDRVVKCFKAAALATGCKIDMEEERIYADLLLNRSLCASYASHMSSYGRNVKPINPTSMTGSTDQGNVTHEIPGLHVIFGIPNSARCDWPTHVRV